MKKYIARLQERREYLLGVLKTIEKNEKTTPKGSLRIQTNGKNVVYYHREQAKDRNGKYLTRKEERLAKRLAQKEYEQDYKKAAQREIKTIEHFLTNYNPNSTADCYSKKNDNRRELIEPFEIPFDEFAKEWASEPYTGKDFGDNAETHYYTAKGDRVRSKTEVLIANTLFEYGIFYKYECPLAIDDFTIYPDFTILRNDDRQIIYWEHFGMMDNPAYCDKALMKINKYIFNGIFPGDNLLMTFETTHVPVNTKILDRMIRQHLL